MFIASSCTKTRENYKETASQQISCDQSGHTELIPGMFSQRIEFAGLPCKFQSLLQQFAEGTTIMLMPGCPFSLVSSMSAFD